MRLGVGEFPALVFKFGKGTQICRDAPSSQKSAGLRKPFRSILLLREVHDLSYDEIAETMDMTLSNVKVTLHRARKKLRESFDFGWEAQA